MIEIVSSNQFKKDLKLAKKRGFKIEKLQKVVDIIVSSEKLPSKYHDHQLTGKYKNFRECHIDPDWLLVYRLDKDVLILFLFRTGTHSDLF